jgi:hypothetical protein
MRRWIVSLLGVGILMACGASSALAHGGCGYGGRYAPYGGHHAYWRGYPTPGYGYGAGYGYGPRCGGYTPYAVGVPYGYGAGYGYGAYPAAGLGVATRNFSFWLQP